MIEINLSPNSSKVKIEDIGGFNFSLLNVKMVVFGLIALYGIEPFVISHYEGEVKALDAKFADYAQKQNIISAKLTKLDAVKKQVETLTKQEEDLNKQMIVVKKIVDIRTNPFKLLKYISENIPKDVWLTTMELDGAELTINGYSKYFKSIGDFLENLKTSVFFNRNITFDVPSEALKEIDGKRVEPFRVKATVERFK